MNKTTNIVFGKDSRRKLFEGLEIAAEAVMTTLGPKGKTVLIQRGDNSPIATKDGVTVSKSINLKDPILKMGADLIKESASQTNEVAGDGTTTSTVLTYAMVKEGLKLLEAGYSAQSLCKGIELAYSEVDKELLSLSKELTTSEEIAQIGTISANGDREIGEIISLAMDKVGKDGIITVEDAKGMTTSLDVVEGLQFERGYLSPYFVNNSDKMIASYNEARVLIVDKKLTSLRELIPILEKVMQSRQPLLIIAEDVEGEALQGLVLNRVNGSLPVVAVKSPGYGNHRHELLNDIATLTGAKIVSSSTGLLLEKVDLKDLGKAKRFVVDSKSTTLVSDGNTKNEVDLLVNNLKSQLEDISLSQEEILKLKTRIAKLAAGVAIIKVGGATEVEMIERKYRIEDALNATKAAAAEGIVPGGGVALSNISNNVSCRFDHLQNDVKVGTSIVLNACLFPLRRISENAGVSPDVILKDLKEKKGIGYDASTGEYVNLIERGVIDPVKVTRTALKNATSVATTFLSLNAVIYEEEYSNE